MGDDVRESKTRCARAARPRRMGPACLLAGLAWTAACSSPPAATPAESAAAAGHAASRPIGCLGRLEPGEGVVRIGARGLGGQPSIVGRLLVGEGSVVSAGQVIAELNSKDQLEAVVQVAEAQVAVARTRLAQVLAGAKPSEVAAQRAEVDRLRADLQNAERELARNKQLGELVSASQLDSLRLRVDTTAKAVVQAERRLASLTEVRPVDAAAARAEVTAAEREATRAKAEFESSVLRSPIDGRVIRVHAWPGEEVGPQGVIEVAVVDPMYAVAEVAESDVPRVRVGQRATVTGDGLVQPLTGVVERIGQKVLQNALMPLDPATFSDGRVVDVRVRLDNPALAVNLVHLRVSVTIEP
jgi:HlyD family secretion protein